MDRTLVPGFDPSRMRDDGRRSILPAASLRGFQPALLPTLIAGAGLLACSASGAVAALDIGFGSIDDLTVVEREGAFPEGVSALSMTTTACNPGAEDIPWLAPMAEAHPVVVMQLYRMEGGRFEQIGVSAARHEYFALSNSLCESCQTQSNGTFLGPGCSTTSGAGINADRNLLGPRSEIDPYLGTWDCTGSLFAGGEPDCQARAHPGEGPLDRRLVVADSDLAVPGAAFVYDAYWLAAGDEDRRNSLGSRSTVAVFAGGQWHFTDQDDEAVGPALERWGGSESWVSLPGDGEVLLSSKSWELSGGLYQYEYALYNLDSARQVGEVRIPYGENLPTEVGFHDPDSDGGNDWSSQLSAGEVVWATTPESVDPDAPALSYGLLYNYRFVSDAPPMDGMVTLVAWRSAGDDEVRAAALVPSSSSGAPDVVDGSGTSGRGRFALSCQPVPIQVGAEIGFRLAQEAPVDLTVFDAAGRQVRTVLAGSTRAGDTSVRWDGRDDTGGPVPPGVYYLRLETTAGTEGLRVPVVR